MNRLTLPFLLFIRVYRQLSDFAAIFIAYFLFFRFETHFATCCARSFTAFLI